MKRQTFIKYYKYFTITVIFLSLTAFYSALIHYFPKDSLATDSPEGKRNITLIIDAGHGGEDGGAVGVGGSLEKDLNLIISQKLYNLLSLTEMNVVMTRHDDKMLYLENQTSRKKFYDLRNRAAFAKQYDNPVFISIHQNKFPISKYNGLQVYYSDNNDNSKILAEFIQNNVISFLQNDNNRKIKRAGGSIYLMKELECPAVLVECGFLSNSFDETNLNDEDYQNKLVFSIFSSILEFINNTDV